MSIKKQNDKEFLQKQIDQLNEQIDEFMAQNKLQECLNAQIKLSQLLTEQKKIKV